MKKFKIGIVGCGGIMQYAHLPAILALREELEIVAVSDIIEERMYKDGIKFYKSENNVWLVKHVPSQYLCQAQYYDDGELKNISERNK